MGKKSLIMIDLNKSRKEGKVYEKLNYGGLVGSRKR